MVLPKLLTVHVRKDTWVRIFFIIINIIYFDNINHYIYIYIYSYSSGDEVSIVHSSKLGRTLGSHRSHIGSTVAIASPVILSRITLI